MPGSSTASTRPSTSGTSVGAGRPCTAAVCATYPICWGRRQIGTGNLQKLANSASSGISVVRGSLGVKVGKMRQLTLKIPLKTSLSARRHSKSVTSSSALPPRLGPPARASRRPSSGHAFASSSLSPKTTRYTTPSSGSESPSASSSRGELAEAVVRIQRPMHTS